jgi:hypothetical protein
MDKELIFLVKKKKDFSMLPDSIVKQALESSGGDVKLARSFLRKYFGVFLTNKVLKPKDLNDWQTILRTHISSKKRNYDFFYHEIFSDKNLNFSSVIDFGCGMNGFSTLPIKSLSGRKDFSVKRKWLINFLQEHFIIKKDFKMNGERILLLTL